MESGILQDFDLKGFAIIENVFSEAEIKRIAEFIHVASTQNENFRVAKDLFAIRNLLGEISELRELILTTGFKSLLSQLPGENYFNTKAIYFDKPAHSNWSVAWHQDTTISVDKRMDIEGFGPWTLKQGLQSVQPSIVYLEDICAIRIHLDDCDETNGALKVVPGSHLKGIVPDVKYPVYTQTTEICTVKRGGVMLMKPLLMHASGKSVIMSNRRVIHLEFSSKELPEGLKWRERTKK